MKIPFDIKYRPQIESGEYKVVTRDNDPVRIICWNASSPQPIIGLVYDSNEKCETVGTFCDNGSWRLGDKDSVFDLFILIPDPELTEFEKGIKRGFLCAGLEDVPTGIIKDTAQELLAIAKKELCKECAANLDGYVRGRLDALKEMDKVCKHEGPTTSAYWPPCLYGGECSNPFHDCINCHRQSTVGIAGTSATKLEGKE